MNAHRSNLYLQIDRTREMKLRAQRICILLALVGILLFMFTACTVAKHPTAGIYASVGGDTDKFKADASGFSFDRNENSPAFIAGLKQIRAMWQSYLALQGLEFIGGKYYDKAGQEIASSQTIKLEELRNANNLDMAKIKLQELKLLEP